MASNGGPGGGGCLSQHRALPSGLAKPPSPPTRDHGQQQGLASLPSQLTSGQATALKLPPDQGFLC